MDLENSLLSLDSMSQADYNLIDPRLLIEYKPDDHPVKSEKPRPFACEFQDCEKRFTRKDICKYHMATHMENYELRPFPCPEEGCNNKYKCDHCSRKFKRKSTQKAHICRKIFFIVPYLGPRPNGTKEINALEFTPTAAAVGEEIHVCTNGSCSRCLRVEA
ncbi:hypothetical protein QBC43DRAFT_290325 [Cladorrhinum sp. PSN259]|nr:hypothetical protein QBC43DRAFT_290325 [Cladorrhinum sp. PSN259]